MHWFSFSVFLFVSSTNGFSNPGAQVRVALLYFFEDWLALIIRMFCTFQASDPHLTVSTKPVGLSCVPPSLHQRQRRGEATDCPSKAIQANILITRHRFSVTWAVSHFLLTGCAASVCTPRMWFVFPLMETENWGHLRTRLRNKPSSECCMVLLNNQIIVF